eukprot:TRINITY_DN17894_c0_g1_i1.p1 TRINITY_DN17894_c0_g1~~TRINITY_DN17894_c0_g1_i1.p1  ORF type:complete len:590 (-),score=118.49 TRINITY_DN17894_c0_g1_i1:38-1807(-)
MNPTPQTEEEIVDQKNEEISLVDYIPIELLCYTFTFLTTRRDIRSAIIVCQRWHEAFFYDEIWKKSYTRFYGKVPKLSAMNITSWTQLFRRRAAQDRFLRRLTRNEKQYISEEKIHTACLLAGYEKAILLFSGQPPQPKILMGDSLINVQSAMDITTTVFKPRDNGSRILVGNGTGLISILTMPKETITKDILETHPNKKKPAKKEENTTTAFQYLKTHTFTDGHNHIHNMNRTIEQIVENDKYLVSLAYNNTVCIWEKKDPTFADAYSYEMHKRSAMKNDISDFEFYQFQVQLAESRNVLPPRPSKKIRTAEEIHQYRLNLSTDEKRSALIKALIFKYPPSLIYIMPGTQLTVIVGLKNGKILLWQSLNNFMLQAHPLPISHAVGWEVQETDAEGHPRADHYLLTLCNQTGDLCLWNVNPSALGTEGKNAKSQTEARLLQRVVLGLDFSVSVRSMQWIPTLSQVMISGHCIHLWSVHIKQEAKYTLNSPREPLHWIAQLGSEDPKVTAECYDDNRSVIVVGFSDGSINVYFAPTAQCLIHLPHISPTNPFALHHIEMNDKTLIAVDDYCIHWRNLEKNAPMSFTYQIQ